jgi:hypothetical protein
MPRTSDEFVAAVQIAAARLLPTTAATELAIHSRAISDGGSAAARFEVRPGTRSSVDDGERRLVGDGERRRVRPVGRETLRSAIRVVAA